MAKKQDRSEQYVRQVIPTHRLNIRTSRGAPSASAILADEQKLARDPGAEKF